VLFGRLNLGQPGLIPSDQTVQIVAVRPVGTEGFFIKEPLNAAPKAHLIGVVLSSNWPAHLTVPTTSEYYYPRARQACR